jgi:hypothetical protein
MFSAILKMGAGGASETLLTVYRTAWRNTLETSFRLIYLYETWCERKAVSGLPYSQSPVALTRNDEMKIYSAVALNANFK